MPVQSATIALKYNNKNLPYIQFYLIVDGLKFTQDNDILNERHLRTAANFCKVNEIPLYIQPEATEYMNNNFENN